VAFYGQKPARLKAMAEDEHVRAMLAKMSASRRARIRTQGGQTMMMRLVDGSSYRRVDAVIEKFGQAAHDVVAGLHIAFMAGAVLTDLQGRRLSRVGRRSSSG
jgi:fructose-1,6-bisphosphatase/inositol monophosphatase family enzyme